MSNTKGPTSEQMQQILGCLQEGSELLGGIALQGQNLETDVRKLERIVIEGNGQPSIVAQIAGIKSEILILREAKTNRTAVLCAVISAAALVLVAALTLLKH